MLPHRARPAAPAAGLLVASLFAPAALAQDPAEGTEETAPAVRQDEDEDDEIVITPNRTASDPLTVPFTTHVVGAEDIDDRAYRTYPQILRDLPGVMVQKTGPGQGSPRSRLRRHQSGHG